MACARNKGTIKTTAPAKTKKKKSVDPTKQRTTNSKAQRTNNDFVAFFSLSLLVLFVFPIGCPSPPFINHQRMCPQLPFPGQESPLWLVTSRTPVFCLGKNNTDSNTLFSSNRNMTPHGQKKARSIDEYDPLADSTTLFAFGFYPPQLVTSTPRKDHGLFTKDWDLTWSVSFPQGNTANLLRIMITQDSSVVMEKPGY